MGAGTDQSTEAELFIAVPGSERRSTGPRRELRLVLPAIVIVEPTDVRPAGVARTHFAALPGASGGRGAAVVRDFTDRQRLAAVLDGGVGLGDVHGPWGGRVGGDGRAGD
jgi:hypothetical protein